MAAPADLDDIVKPILDALGRHIYIDDVQVERLLVQRFDPDRAQPFVEPTTTLQSAFDSAGPVLCVRVSDDPFEDLP